MAIIINLDVMLARRKMRSRDLAQHIGIAEQNVSLLKSGKVKGIRFDTLEKYAKFWNANRAIFSNIALMQIKHKLYFCCVQARTCPGHFIGQDKAHHK